MFLERERNIYIYIYVYTHTVHMCNIIVMIHTVYLPIGRGRRGREPLRQPDAGGDEIV